ncbi:MAG: integral rane protein MviN, virulence factor [Candidatus Parcubacteria bacterium]|jgi:putative peptidoglycan lipid II flippase
MVRRLFTRATGSVTAAAAVLGLATLASRLVGIFRDRLLSGTFGAGPELDAYYAAFRTPDLIYNLFVLGAITAGFIPIFTATLAKDGADGADGIGDAGNELASALMTVLGAGLCVLACLGIAAAPRIVGLVTPGFEPAQRALAVSLTRIMFVSPIFLGLSSVLGGILQTKRRFFIYAAAPVMYNLGIIAGTALLAPAMGIRGSAYGVAIGSFAHFLVQAFACRAIGFRFRLRWAPSHEGVKAIGRLTVPRVAGLAVSQVNLFILTGMASTLGAGGIAVFNLANNLQNFPVGILGVSFAVAAFPLISELAAKGKDEELAVQFSRTSRTILFLAIPATIAFLLLRAQIVRVILGTGRFDWNDTIDTANTLAWFTISLFAQTLYPLVVRAFFAFHDVRTPLATAIFAVVVERSLAWYLLSKGMGAPGLALAFSVGSILDLALLWVLLRHRLGDLGESRIFRALARMSVAGLLMAAAIQGLKILVADVVDMRTFMGIFAQGAVAATAGVAVYVAAAYLMGSDEARDVVRMYRRRFVPVPAESQLAQEGEAIIVE